MKILVIESEDAGLDFVLRCVAAGHQVRYWLSPNASQHIGQGFKGVEFVKNWTQSAKWADLVFPTGNDNYINRLEYFRRAGVAVFAPSVQSAKLETDSDFGMEFLENHWIECPERKTFETLADAEAFARKSSERWVVRTEDKSYCAKSPADLVALLQRWQRTGMNGQCMLQKFIVGSGLKVGGWMGKEGFSGLPNEQLGRLAGGAVVKYCTRSDLFEMVLKPLEDALVSLEHFGHITVNCIIDEDGKAWPARSEETGQERGKSSARNGFNHSHATVWGVTLSKRFFCHIFRNNEWLSGSSCRENLGSRSNTLCEHRHRADCF